MKKHIENKMLSINKYIVTKKECFYSRPPAPYLIFYSLCPPQNDLYIPDIHK